LPPPREVNYKTVQWVIPICDAKSLDIGKWVLSVFLNLVSKHCHLVMQVFSEHLVILPSSKFSTRNMEKCSAAKAFNLFLNFVSVYNS
jgi:hypothetical protein